MIPQVKCINCKNLRRNGWCEQVADSPHEDLDRRCDFFKPCTNGDYIRRMTDDELGAFLCDLFANDEHELCEDCPADKYCQAGGDGFKVWLKEEHNE